VGLLPLLTYSIFQRMPRSCLGPHPFAGPSVLSSSWHCAIRPRMCSCAQTPLTGLSIWRAHSWQLSRAQSHLPPFHLWLQQVKGRSIHRGGMDVQLWLDALPTFRHMLQDLTLWVRGACLFVLPDEILGDIIHMAWEFFCAMLLFPQTCIAFEMFSATPVSTPEEARFHLPGVGPLGPPPPAHVPPFLGWWEAGPVFISPDDMVDLNVAAVAAIPVLGSITDWVVEAPVAALPSATLGEVSCLTWELFIASLRIPHA
jgi:hypothetical protein